MAVIDAAAFHHQEEALLVDRSMEAAVIPGSEGSVVPAARLRGCYSGTPRMPYTNHGRRSPIGARPASSALDRVSLSGVCFGLFIDPRSQIRQQVTVQTPVSEQFRRSSHHVGQKLALVPKINLSLNKCPYRIESEPGCQ